jgi:hypothetical protein
MAQRTLITVSYNKTITDLFFQRSLWNVILTSRDAKIKSRGLPISASRDPKAPLQRSKLIVAEIEGLDSIHKQSTASSCQYASVFGENFYESANLRCLVETAEVNNNKLLYQQH